MGRYQIRDSTSGRELSQQEYLKPDTFQSLQRLLATSQIIISIDSSQEVVVMDYSLRMMDNPSQLILKKRYEVSISTGKIKD